MKRSINSLTGYSVKGTDGEIGHVTGFYFDDRTSTIRYMVVKTGYYFSKRNVLVSTEAVQKVDWKSKTFSVNLTQKKIKNSPDIDTHKPISRQHEEFMRGYYCWPGYYGYGNDNYLGLGMWGYPDVAEVKAGKHLQEMIAAEHRDGITHLRNTHEVTGYNIYATDGEVGKVHDFLIDDQTWRINFLVVKTSNWFSMKKVLFSPDTIKEINWKAGSLVIETTLAKVQSGPEYHRGQGLTQAYAWSYYDHYNS